MMTEELPPLPVKGPLTASHPCPLPTKAVDETSCLLKAVESNGSTNSHYYDPNFGQHSSLEIESREQSHQSPTGLSASKGNGLHTRSSRAESCLESNDAKFAFAQSFKYRGNPDGEAPVLYDYESTSQCPTSNRRVSHPAQFDQTTANTESASNIDSFNNIVEDVEIPSSVSNGDIVFISEDVRAEQKRTSNYIRSQSVKQNKRVSEGDVTSNKHPPIVRTKSESHASGLNALPRGSSDLGKLSLLDQQFVQSPLTRAIFLGDHAQLLDHIKQGEDPLQVCPTSGCSFFHLITHTSTSDRELSWVPMVFLLSNAGADPNVKDKDGVSPIAIAISRKLVQMVAALLKCGAEADDSDMFQAEQIRGVVKSEMMEILRRLTPSYWSAVHDLTPFKVNRLVKAWARVNVSRYGKTLIEYAKENAKDSTIVRLLLQNEASIELAHAVMAGDRDRVKVLLNDSAVDLNTSDTSVKNNYFEPFAPLTLYGAAVKLGHIGVLNELKAAAAQSRSFKGSFSYSGASFSGSGASTRGMGPNTSALSMKDTTVVFYKGKSNEEVCEIRNASKPVTSALCVIV